MSGNEQVGWFDALGNKVPHDQREAAVQEARKMGVDASANSPWVNEVADLVEKDRPKKAIETARIVSTEVTTAMSDHEIVIATGGKHGEEVVYHTRDCPWWPVDGRTFDELAELERVYRNKTLRECESCADNRRRETPIGPGR